MVDIIPPIFSTPASAIASYDFIEFAAGEAIKTLYLADIEGGAGILTSNSTLYGKEGVISVGDVGTIDKDFDLLVGKPFDSGTTVYFSIMHAMTTNTGVSPTNGITIYVRKYSGTTETDLGNTDVTFRSGTFGSGTGFTPLTGKITIPVTHFAIGDYIRITISETFPDLAGSQTWYFGTDPAGRSSTSVNWASPLTNGRSSIFFPIKVTSL